MTEQLYCRPDLLYSLDHAVDRTYNIHWIIDYTKSYVSLCLS